MSTVALPRRVEEPLGRSPGTGARILLFFASVAGSGVLFGAGFPPAAPDRLPLLLLAVGLALVAAWKPERAIVAFAFLVPCAGLVARLCGGTNPLAWPALLLGGLAAGWSFRFIYDFESASEPSPLDRPLRALLFVWVLATVVAAARAWTVWAALQGLRGRAVNSEGLLEDAALRESFVALSALAAGAVFFFLLRREGAALRSRALRAACLGAALSAAAAGLQRAGILPQESSAYWKMTGRLSGGASDPNSLGMLCALALVPILASALGSTGQDRTASTTAALVLAAGLVLSGSRSGLLLLLAGFALWLLIGRMSPRARRTSVAVFGLSVLAFAIFLAAGSGGSLGGRISQSFDPSLPVEYRVSARPALWRAAWRLFLRHPVEGAGMGAFSWELPDLTAGAGRLAMRDNPGSAYVQALAETGLAGGFLTVLFVLSLGAAGLKRARETGGLAAGAGSAVVAFLAVMALGSHWFAPDVSLFAFLLAAVAAAPAPVGTGLPGNAGAGNHAVSRGGRSGLDKVILLAVLVYTVAAAAAVAATARAEVTFRYAPRIGFHDKEMGPGGPFRWTRRKFALQIAPGSVSRMVLAHYSPSREPVDLAVKADGQTVFRRTLKAGEAVRLRLNGLSGKPRVFLFAVSRAFVPKSLGLSQDRRELGLLSIEE